MTDEAKVKALAELDGYAKLGVEMPGGCLVGIMETQQRVNIPNYLTTT